jgi:hypothetical protein
MPPWYYCQSVPRSLRDIPSSVPLLRPPCRNTCRKYNRPWGLSIVSVDSPSMVEHTYFPRKAYTNLSKRTRTTEFRDVCKNSMKGWNGSVGEKQLEEQQRRLETMAFDSTNPSSVQLTCKFVLHYCVYSASFLNKCLLLDPLVQGSHPDRFHVSLSFNLRHCP